MAAVEITREELTRLARGELTQEELARGRLTQAVLDIAIVITEEDQRRTSDPQSQATLYRQRVLTRITRNGNPDDRMNIVSATMKALTLEIYTFYSNPENVVKVPDTGDNETSRANMRRVIEDARSLIFISGPPNTTDHKLGYLFPSWLDLASQANNQYRAECDELMEDYMKKIRFLHDKVYEYETRITTPTIPAPAVNYTAAPGENTGKAHGGRRKTKKVKTNRRYTRKR